MNERRAFKRLPAEAEVTVRPLDDGESAQGHGKDLSGGGILFMTAQRLAVDSLAEIEVRHPGRLASMPPLRALIRVVRVSGELPPFEIAGEFVDIR